MTSNVFGGTLNLAVSIDIWNDLGMDHECDRRTDGQTDRQNRC